MTTSAATTHTTTAAARGRGRVPDQTSPRERRNKPPQPGWLAAGRAPSDQGASVTRFALPTSALGGHVRDPTRGSSDGGNIDQQAAVTSAAICTTPISGTASRLSTSPAPVTREKSGADTGRSAISIASDAKTDAMIHESAAISASVVHRCARPRLARAWPRTSG